VETPVNAIGVVVAVTSDDMDRERICRSNSGSGDDSDRSRLRRTQRANGPCDASVATTRCSSIDGTWTSRSENPVSGVEQMARTARKVGATRFERCHDSTEKTAVVDGGGAFSGALPPDLAVVVAAWSTLTDDQRERVVGIIRGGARR
jgi:hypothetical protein